MLFSPKNDRIAAKKREDFVLVNVKVCNRGSEEQKFCPKKFYDVGSINTGTVLRPELHP